MKTKEINMKKEVLALSVLALLLVGCNGSTEVKETAHMHTKA